MKTLTWDESLSVEVAEIDEDHRRLVELFNLLSGALSEAAEPSLVDALLEELICCTAWHFSHEERLMLQTNYPERESHTKEHQELIARVRELQQSRETLQAEDVDFLEQWLTGHIFASDMVMGRYIAAAL